MGINFINILSDEQNEDYFHGLISENFLKDHMNGSRENVYLCGPPQMMTLIELQLGNLGISKRAITKEAF